jgi:hypothetical protein
MKFILKKKEILLSLVQSTGLLVFSGYFFSFGMVLMLILLNICFAGIGLALNIVLGNFLTNVLFIIYLLIILPVAQFRLSSMFLEYLWNYCQNKFSVCNMFSRVSFLLMTLLFSMGYPIALAMGYSGLFVRKLSSIPAQIASIELVVLTPFIFGASFIVLSKLEKRMDRTEEILVMLTTLALLVFVVFSMMTGFFIVF